jgi:hypothetical protein
MYKEKKNIVRIHGNNCFVKLQQEIFCSWLVLIATIHPHSKFGNSVPLKVVEKMVSFQILGLFWAPSPNI